MSELLSITQAAQRLGVGVDTLRTWERNGKLRAIRTVGGHRRFDAQDVDKLGVALGLPAQQAANPSTRTGDQAERARTPRTAARAPAEDSYWQNRAHDERARAQFLKAEHEATSLIEERQAKFVNAAQQAEESRRREEHRARLEKLKEYGRTLSVQAGLPAEWRASVTAELERHVSPERFPMSLSDNEAHDYVRARVNAIVGRYRDEQSRALEQQRRAAELERGKARAAQLIEWGKERALWSTAFWESDERDRARYEVGRELAEQVQPGWSEDDVKVLVDDVLAEWEEGDDGDDLDEDDEVQDDDDGEIDDDFDDDSETYEDQDDEFEDDDDEEAED